MENNNSLGTTEPTSLKIIEPTGTLNIANTDYVVNNTSPISETGTIELAPTPPRASIIFTDVCDNNKVLGKLYFDFERQLFKFEGEFEVSAKMLVDEMNRYHGGKIVGAANSFFADDKLPDEVEGMVLHLWQDKPCRVMLQSNRPHDIGCSYIGESESLPKAIEIAVETFNNNPPK